MNILIYNSNEPLPEQGGMERVTDLLARALSERGVRVVLLYRWSNRLNRRYEAPVEIYQLSEESAQSNFVNVVKSRDINIVIDQTEGGIIGPKGIFETREEAHTCVGSQLRYVAVQHSSAKSYIDNMCYVLLDSQASGVAKRLTNMLKRIFYLPLKRAHACLYIQRKFADLNKNYDRIVTLSPSFIDDFFHFYPSANREKLIAIPDLNTFESVQTSAMKKRVLFVGRLTINPKGVDRLLRIWENVEDLVTNWELDIVGDGVDREKLEDIARKLSLKRVTFHGYQDPKIFYEKSSIFCMTSTYEGFGMVLTEAMQHGCVPIAFDSYSSVRDIIDDGINGLLIKPFDESEYSAKLYNLITDEKKRKMFSNEAIKKSEVFSKENIYNKWRALFENLMQ